MILCVKRGALSEVVSAFVFIFSGIVVVTPLINMESGNQLMRAVLQRIAAPSQLDIGMLFWYASIYLFAVSVLILFIRLMASFTIFDNDSGMCEDWINPLHNRFALLEVCVRILIYGYLLLSIGGMITSISFGVADRLLELEESALAQSFGGALLHESAAAFLNTEMMQNDVRRLFITAGYLVDLLALCVIWDGLLYLGRRAGYRSNAVFHLWLSRFLIPHISALLLVFAFIVTLYVSLVRQDPFESFAALVFFCVIYVVSVFTLARNSYPILMTWFNFLKGRASIYAMRGDCHESRGYK